MLDLVTPTFRFLWPFSFLFIDGQRSEVVFHLAQCFLMPSVVAVKLNTLKAKMVFHLLVVP